MVNQTPDGVTLERQNPALNIQGNSLSASPLSDIFAAQASAQSPLQLMDHDIQALREKVQKFDPFTFANGNQAAMLNQVGMIAMGSPIAGIATAALNREEFLKRQEQERRDSVNATVAAMTAQELARHAAASVADAFANNKAAVATAINNYDANIAAGQDDQVIAEKLADDMEGTFAEAVQSTVERTGVSEQEAAESVAPQFMEQLVEEGVAERHAEMTAETLMEDLAARSLELNAGANRVNEAGTGITLNLFGGAGTNDEFEIGTKDKAAEMLVHMQSENEAYIAAQREDLGSLKADLASLRSNMDKAQTALEAESNGAFSAEIQASIDQQAQQLEQIEQEIARQEHIVNLQEEVNGLVQDYANTLMPQLNDDMSNMDIDFMKQSIINAPPELIAKSQELAELTGNTGNDPISQLAALADSPESNLNDAQRAEIRQFVTDVKQALTNKADADQLVAQASEIMQNERAMDPDGLGTTFNDPTMNRFMAAAMPTGEDRMRIALDERDAAIEELNALAGVESAEANPLVATETESAVQEAPAPAPTEGYISGIQPADLIYAATNEDGIIELEEAQELLRKTYGFSDDKIAEIMPEIARDIERDGAIISGFEDAEPLYVSGLIVNGRLPEPERIATAQPTAPQPAPEDYVQNRPLSQQPVYNTFAPAA